MSLSKQKKAYAQLIVIALVLISLCLAGVILVESINEISFSFLLDNPLLLVAVVMQIMVGLALVNAWKSLLDSQTGSPLLFSECSAQIGITLLGKYLPGKVWGLIGRNFLLTQRGVSQSNALGLLLVDQILIFTSSAFIGLAALIAFYSAAASILYIFAFGLLLGLLGKNLAAVINWALRKAKFLFARLVTSNEPMQLTIEPGYLLRSFSAYSLYWVLGALVLCLLFYPLIESDLRGGITIIVAAVPLAMLLGFVAIWAPGGIGVREGVLIAILGIQMPLDQAAIIAICFRLVCILFDLALGGFSLAYYTRNDPALLQQFK